VVPGLITWVLSPGAWSLFERVAVFAWCAFWLGARRQVLSGDVREHFSRWLRLKDGLRRVPMLTSSDSAIIGARSRIMTGIEVGLKRLARCCLSLSPVPALIFGVMVLFLLADGRNRLYPGLPRKSKQYLNRF